MPSANGSDAQRPSLLLVFGVIIAGKKNLIIAPRSKNDQRAADFVKSKVWLNLGYGFPGHISKVAIFNMIIKIVFAIILLIYIRLLPNSNGS